MRTTVFGAGNMGRARQWPGLHEVGSHPDAARVRDLEVVERYEQ